MPHSTHADNLTTVPLSLAHRCLFHSFKVLSSVGGKVKFRSNIFGSMGAGLFVAPNTIDFSTVFQNLDQKLLDNIAVVATVLGLIILYIILLIIARRFDKRDELKVC